MPSLKAFRRMAGLLGSLRRRPRKVVAPRRAAEASSVPYIRAGNGRPGWKVGDRVYVEPEEEGFPFGAGTITEIGDVWEYSGQHPPKHWFTVRLDKPAQRHSSDGPPRRMWDVAHTALRDANA